LHKFSENESTFERFYQAQVLRDEAMAETLAEFLSKNPDYKAIVLVGKGHILNRWGLYYALKKRVKQPIISIILGDVPFFSPEIADYVFQPPKVEIKRTPKLGVVLEEVKEGLLIKELKPGSLAEKIGLMREDVILEINNKRVHKVSDLKLILTFLEDDENLIFKIKRGNREKSLKFKPF
jgi:membrane-associated protease RseP (regulator of RpoE activity)